MGKAGAFLLGVAAVVGVAGLVVWRKFIVGWDEQEKLVREVPTDAS